MKSTWPVDKIIKHVISIFGFIFILILNLIDYIGNPFDNITYRVMLGLILLTSLVFCYRTGKSLKKSKIYYK